MNQELMDMAEQAINSIPDHVDFDIPDVFKEAFAALVAKAAVAAEREAQRTWGKPWVSLTDEEISECYEATYEYGMSMNDLPQIIEAKLKEKNT